MAYSNQQKPEPFQVKARVNSMSPGKPTTRGTIPTVFDYTVEGQGESTANLVFDSEVLTNVGVGDIVLLDLVQKGKYTNILGVTVVEKAPPPPKGYTNSGGGGNKFEESPEKQKNIHRSVALQTAVALYAERPKAGLPDVLVAADAFFKWLTDPESDLPEVPAVEEPTE